MAVERQHREYFKLQVIVWGVFIGGIFTSIIFLIASVTERWVFLTPTAPIVFVGPNAGLMIEWRRSIWRDCLLEKPNSTTEVSQRWRCYLRNFFPSHENIAIDDETDYSILDYSRSVAAFSVITLVISLLPIFFSWYSIKEPRYIFKRLAAGLYFITAGCAIVSIEVFKRFLDYGKLYLPKSAMKLVNKEYGFSFYLACISVGLYCLAGVVIFVASGKKKGPRARSMKEAAENEPVIIGRL